LEDIEKRRAVLPDDQNAALIIKAAAALIPPELRENHEIFALDDLWPQHQLAPQQIELLRTCLDQVVPAAVLARKALVLKTGRFPLSFSGDAHYRNDGKEPHADEVRALCQWLAYLAVFQIQIGKNDEAWQVALTILAAARSFGEVPNLVTQLAARTILRRLVVDNLERNLAQGEVSDALLAQAQEILAAEASQPVFYHAMQGDRGSYHQFWTEFEAGQHRELMRIDMPFWSRAALFLKGNTFKGYHAQGLAHLNQLVEAGKEPPLGQVIKSIKLSEKRMQVPALARLLLPDTARISQSTVSAIAALECARAAIGVERFRLKKRTWPIDLHEVIAARVLDKLPADPFDNKPLRFRRTNHGVMVYSVGMFKNYEAVALEDNRDLSPKERGPEFGLWDEAHRRQPPRARAKDDDKDR
jgi:hypothetical protein